MPPPNFPTTCFGVLTLAAPSSRSPTFFAGAGSLRGPFRDGKRTLRTDSADVFASEAPVSPAKRDVMPSPGGQGSGNDRRTSAREISNVLKTLEVHTAILYHNLLRTYYPTYIPTYFIMPSYIQTNVFVQYYYVYDF